MNFLCAKVLSSFRVNIEKKIHNFENLHPYTYIVHTQEINLLTFKKTERILSIYLPNSTDLNFLNFYNYLDKILY